MPEIDIAEHKKPFVVHIKESYSRNIVIWAKDETQAEAAADKLCDAGEIDLSRNCYNGRSVSVDRVAELAEANDYDHFDCE